MIVSSMGGLNSVEWSYNALKLLTTKAYVRSCELEGVMRLMQVSARGGIELQRLLAPMLVVICRLSDAFLSRTSFMCLHVKVCR